MAFQIDSSLLQHFCYKTVNVCMFIHMLPRWMLRLHFSCWFSRGELHQWHFCGRRGRPACFGKFTAVCFSGQVFRIVSTCLGNPPETFCWEFRDKEKNYHKYGPMTPVEFYNEHVKPYFNMEDKVRDAERQWLPKTFLLLSLPQLIFPCCKCPVHTCNCTVWDGYKSGGPVFMS